MIRRDFGNHFWRLAFVIILSAFSYSASALIKIKISENESVLAKVSAKELTRIFVRGDTIQSVRGIEGAYVLTKDTTQGEIYIKPAPAYQNKAFNIFLSTQQGRNYTLFLTPTQTPAEVIELDPTTAGKEADHWERASVYQRLLTQLVIDMVNNDPPDGYAVYVPDPKTKPVHFGNKVMVKLRTIYQGEHLRGEVLEVHNLSKETLQLAETSFYQPGTRALALEDQQLPPNYQTLLYRVMNYGG